jgi:signal transduction histidine kinase
MTDQKYIAREVLRKAFPGIPQREAEEMVSIGQIQQFPVGVTLCKEDAVENTFYIILEGQVQVTKVINEKEARWLKFLDDGDFFGEMGLIHDAPRAATVSTSQPTTVLCIEKSAFEQLLQHSSSVSLAMVKEVSRRLRENDEMAIEDLRLKAGELATAYQRLAQEDFARREFLTSIAHELRTPLTSASGFLEMARSRRVDRDLRNMAYDTVTRNLQQIISLVNDILFLQEVELVLPEMHLIDLGEVVIAAVEAIKPQAEEHNIGLKLDIAPKLIGVPGHFKSLERALKMVIDNAIKFSPSGGDVQIIVSCKDESVSVQVVDQGIGISDESLPHIFDRFFHVDEIGDELYGGLGLGLAITKQVVDQHDGEISVTSEENKGSTFTITLHYNEDLLLEEIE